MNLINPHNWVKFFKSDMPLGIGVSIEVPWISLQYQQTVILMLPNIDFREQLRYIYIYSQSL